MHTSPSSVKLLKNPEPTDRRRVRRNIFNQRNGLFIKRPISLFTWWQSSRPSVMNCSLSSTQRHKANQSLAIVLWCQRKTSCSVQVRLINLAAHYKWTVFGEAAIVHCVQQTRRIQFHCPQTPHPPVLLDMPSLPPPFSGFPLWNYKFSNSYEVTEWNHFRLKSSHHKYYALWIRKAITTQMNKKKFLSSLQDITIIHTPLWNYKFSILWSNRLKPFLGWSHRVTNLNLMNLWSNYNTIE